MGFLGSWHCGVMCGPLSCNFSAKKQFLSYHIGRLISYLILGALLFLGTHFFIDSDSRPIKLLASLLFGGVFIFYGLTQLNILRKRPFLFKFYKMQFTLLEKNRALVNRFPLALGLLTGLFPCGWLYTFLMLSSQMKSIYESILIIMIFWASSLPAFLVFTGFMKALISGSPLRYQTISGYVLIVSGVLSILGHWAFLVA